MGFDFTLNEWVVVGLVFLLGLILGIALAAGGGKKHKVRYQDEHRRANELAAENERLRKDVSHTEVAAARARTEPVRTERI